jgi:hypothetical protein
VIGATGRVGTLVGAGCWLRGNGYRPWSTTQANARDRLRPDSRLDNITGDLDTPADPHAAFRGADTAYVALGSIGVSVSHWHRHRVPVVRV